MIPPEILLLVYCGLIVLASLAGGWLPTVFKLTHIRMQMTMSLVSGIMLGVALLHMLPHACEHMAVSWVAGSMLAGLLVMFFLLRVFHVHDHGVGHGHDGPHCGHGDGHGHSHDERQGVGQEHGPYASAGERHRLSWTGLFFGLAVHTLIDGIALGASVAAESHYHSAGLGLLGLGTFLAVVLHKPMDALSITSLMRAGNWSARSQMFANCGFALACPVGAMLFWFGVSDMPGQSAAVGIALGFSAGFFLCIALGDLLPEVQFHSHDRIKLSAALVAGVALAVGIEMFHFHGHPHQHDGRQAEQQAAGSQR